MKIPRYKNRYKILAVVGAVVLIAYLAVSNTTPLSYSQTFSWANKGVTALSPLSRTKKMDGAVQLLDDLVYFGSTRPSGVNNLAAKVKLRNANPDQVIRLGLNDQEGWHFTTQILDASFLDALSWPRVGSGPYLYQKIPTYQTVAAFTDSPPASKVVGVFDLRDDDFLHPVMAVQNYKPSPANTTITAPLRGQITMYAYLDNEPFTMSVTKRDINWYNGPDPMEVTVYKGTAKVSAVTAGDDGDQADDHTIGTPQTVRMQSPGPGFPEAGVYKIVIAATADSIITNITTNLHKLVFEGPINPVSNSDLFGGVVANTAPTTLYSDGLQFTAQTNHPLSLQTITVNNTRVALTNVQTPAVFSSNSAQTKIILPKSDVILNGEGVFAFSPDQLFVTTPYHLVPINNAEDLAQADYVITDYAAPRRLGGGWLEADGLFDISQAIAPKGNLNWVIESPGLRNSNNTVEVQSVELSYTKKGWFKK